MNSSDYGRLAKLIKMNDNRIRSKRCDIGKSKEQLMIEKVEAIIKGKKSEFLEQRVETSEMAKRNKMAKLGQVTDLNNHIWQVHTHTRTCYV